MNCANRLAYCIRLAELECRGAAQPVNETHLFAEGQIAGAHMWHYFAHGHMMLNSTPTAPDQEATAIPTNHIIAIVREVLETYMNY
jgi:hypothetical protein